MAKLWKLGNFTIGGVFSLPHCVNHLITWLAFRFWILWIRFWIENHICLYKLNVYFNMWAQNQCLLLYFEWVCNGRRIHTIMCYACPHFLVLFTLIDYNCRQSNKLVKRKKAWEKRNAVHIWLFSFSPRAHFPLHNSKRFHSSHFCWYWWRTVRLAPYHVRLSPIYILQSQE